jgi:hypothetical protein
MVSVKKLLGIRWLEKKRDRSDPMWPPSASAPITPLGPITKTHASTADERSGGLLSTLSGLFRSHRPAVAGVLAAITVAPLLAAGAPLAAQPPPDDHSAPPAAHRTVANRPAHRAVPAKRPAPVVVNAFKSVKGDQAKLDLLRLKGLELDQKSSTMDPTALKTTRQKLYDDYVAGGGKLGIKPAAASDNDKPISVAQAYAFGEPTRDINPGNITDFGLFKYYWETEGNDGIGLARHGLDEVTPAGVPKLAEYARTHELDGTPKKPELYGIDPDERAVMRAILKHEHYGTFFEVDARGPLYKAFGIDQSTASALAAMRPVKIGDIDIQSTSENRGALRYSRSDLAAKMTSEYESRRSFFEDPSQSEQTLGLRAVGLLKDYADGLWASGEQGDTENIGYQLLDAFGSFKYADVYGTKDYNGAGWSLAQSLVLGLDANTFETHFPDANGEAEVNYLSMDGGMAESMKYVDMYREAAGQSKGAEAFELKSPLGWMLDLESGHKKAGNLDEKKPFSSSGLNWGVLLFPGDSEVANLPPKSDFEFPIDLIDGFGHAITASPMYGDHIVVQDKDGKGLKVEKQIQKDDSGKPVSWSAVFKDASGAEVKPEDVIGLVQSGFGGGIKGDGKISRSLDMWWWGFCDRNTAQRLYKSKYHLPQIDRDVTIVENGKTIVIPKAIAQKLVDMDMPDLVPHETMEGFRFNDEPQHVKLKNGQVLTARIHDLQLDAGPGTKRIGADIIAIYDAPGRPMLGTIEVTAKDASSPTGIDVRYIDTITDNGDETVTVKMNSDYEGYNKEVTGKLTTGVPWDQAVTEKGKKVLHQNQDTYAIRGGFTLDLSNGTTKRIDASEVSEISGETMHDVRISQFMVWAAQNKGIFATDGSIGVVVSNGMRWVNDIDRAQVSDDYRPSWAGTAKLKGIQGPLARVEGDKILWVRALYSYQPKQDPTGELFSGWIQVDKNGRILNEGFVNGQPDFGWSGDGKLNWSNASSFNPYMVPELRLKLFVNGVSDQSKLAALAEQGNLPSDWRSSLIPQPPPPAAPAPAPETPPTN